MDGLYIIEMNRDKVEMNKPIYVGTTILDVSKISMMRFHYELIEKDFEGRYFYLYGDTDSCAYQIFTNETYKRMHEKRGHFDLTDCKIDWLKDSTNNKVPGKFKDELGGFCIDSFCGLNPKCHSYTHQSSTGMDNKRKAKGVSKAVVKSEVKHDDYTNTLATGESLERDTMRFQSVRHEVYTIVQPKKCLSTFYDKFQMLDEYNNVPYGYIDVNA